MQEKRIYYNELDQEKREEGRHMQYNILNNDYLMKLLTAPAQAHCPPSHSHISLKQSDKEAC